MIHALFLRHYILGIPQLLKCFCYSSGTCQVYVARRKIPLTVLDFVMFLIELFANMLNLLVEFESSIIFPVLSSSEGGTFEELQLYSYRCWLVLWVCPPSRSWWIMGVSWAIKFTTGEECCWEFWSWRVGTMPWHKAPLEVWSLILAVLSACKCTSEEEYLWGFPTGIVGTRQLHKIHWSSVLVFHVPSWSTLGLAWFGWQSIWRVLNHLCLVIAGPMILYPPGTKITCGLAAVGCSSWLCAQLFIERLETRVNWEHSLP